MNIERLYKIILAPHVSEKTIAATEKTGQVAFRVTTDATKTEIKAAVERLFNVQVDKVRVLNVKGKVKANKFGAVRRSSWKKAYVQLAAGHDIDFAAI